MAVQFAMVLAVAAVSAMAIFGWRVLNWAWFRPTKFEKQLRGQGLKGNPYNLLFADFKELLKMNREAQFKPMSSVSHDLVPRVMPFFQKLFMIHGQNFFLWSGPHPVVNIMEPELIKEMFFKYNQFQKPKGGNPLGIKGLLGEDGEKWVKNRRIINPAFHIEKLKKMLPAFYLSCMEMVEKWEEIVSKKEGSCEVDVWPHLKTLSADVISRNAFGSSYEEGRRIFQLQQDQTDLLIEASRSIKIARSRFWPTKRNKRVKEIAREVKASILSIINRRLKAMTEGKTSNDDLLGILLDSNYKEIKQHGDTNSGLSIDEVIEECRLFYFAGQETTANLLVWTMVLLGQHQYWQEQAREEIFRFFGNEKPDHDGLNHLKIVSMILSEVLRLYPPAIILRRQLVEDTKIGDFTLPAGVHVQVPVIMLHHDRELWGADPNEFKPERFSEGVSKATKGQASYIPFGGGPRICVGQNFAMLEVKMAIAMILQRFSFALSTSYSHAPHAFPTLQPQHGAHLILQKL